jgi:DNA-binding IclR family transcriptional regulator
MLSVLGLFSVERSAWTVNDAAVALGASPSTTYRYFRSLATADLISSVDVGTYVLGPAIIQFDRQMRITDPLIRAARPLMRPVVAIGPEDSVALLCRFYRDQVMCVHEEYFHRPLYDVSYERGLPMPPYRGAPSKAILSHLPIRKVHSLYQRFTTEFMEAGLGSDWLTVKRTLRAMRAEPAIYTHSELGHGWAGIATAVLDGNGLPIASLALVMPLTSVSESLRLAAIRAVGEAGRMLTMTLRDA